jgi:hypothetical protein
MYWGKPARRSAKTVPIAAADGRERAEYDSGGEDGAAPKMMYRIPLDSKLVNPGRQLDDCRLNAAVCNRPDFVVHVVLFTSVFPVIAPL